MSPVSSRRTVLAGLAALPLLPAAARHADAAGAERPFNLRVILSGHSLTDPLPHPLSIFVQAAGGVESRGMVIDASTIPGSTARLRWEPEMYMQIDAKRDIANYDTLVLTERVPVRPTIEWEDSLEVTRKWLNLAWTKGNGGKGANMIYYASWIDINSGPGNTDEWDIPAEREIPFRERLDLEMGSWQQVADSVNASRPAGCPAMRVIPGPKIMAAAFDAIKAGTAPGLSAIRDLFEDGIHPNAKGAYMIALAHFAVIYGRDPRSVPKLHGEAGWPTPEQAKWMKELVWDVLSAYPDSGLA